MGKTMIARMIRATFAALALCCVITAGAETLTNPLIIGGTLQGSQATVSFKIPSGTANPATCRAGQLFFNTTTPALEYCSATNTWTAVGTSAGTVTSVATGSGLTGGPITTTGTINLANSAAVSHQFFNSVVGNVLVGAQPGFADISGTATAGQGGTGSSSVPTAGQFPVGNAGGTAYAPVTLSQDVACLSTGACTVGSLNGGNYIPVTGGLALGGLLYVSDTTLSAGHTNFSFAAITGLVLGNGTSAPSAYAGSSPTACSNQFNRGPTLSASGVLTLNCASVAIGSDVSGLGTGVATALAVNTGSNGAFGTNAFTSGTSRTLSAMYEIVVCTTTCTVTPPGTLVPGSQFCVQNDDNVSTVITLAAVAGIQYESTARTSYGTANHTMTSAGAVKDQICFVAVSTTKYNNFSSVGTWTNN